MGSFPLPAHLPICLHPTCPPCREPNLRHVDRAGRKMQPPSSLNLLLRRLEHRQRSGCNGQPARGTSRWHRGDRGCSLRSNCEAGRWLGWVSSQGAGASLFVPGTIEGFSLGHTGSFALVRWGGCSGDAAQENGRRVLFCSQSVLHALFR